MCICVCAINLKFKGVVDVRVRNKRNSMCASMLVFVYANVSYGFKGCSGY